MTFSNLTRTGRLHRAWPVLALLAAVPVWAFQTKPQLSDKSQGFAMWFSDQSFEFPDPSTVLFDVTGNPVHGYSKEQNLTFACKSMTGRLEKDTTSKQGKMYLRRGEMTGAVDLSRTLTNGNATFSSDKLTLVDSDAEATVECPTAFTFSVNSKDAKVDRKSTMKAPHGTFTLTPLKSKADRPLKGAEITGPVTLTTTETDQEQTVTTLVLTAKHVTAKADGTDLKLTCSGGVHIDGDQTLTKKPGFFGSFDVEEAIVVLDADFNVKKITSKGNPGTGVVKDKKGG